MTMNIFMKQNLVGQSFYRGCLGADYARIIEVHKGFFIQWVTLNVSAV